MRILDTIPGLRKTRTGRTPPKTPAQIIEDMQRPREGHGRPAPQDPGLGTDTFVRSVQQGEFDQRIADLFKSLDQNADNEQRLDAVRGFIVAIYKNQGLEVSEERINEVVEAIRQRLPDVVVIRVESAERSTTTYEPSAEVDDAEVEA